MTIEESTRRIKMTGVVPVIRAASVEEATRAVEAVCAGGITVIELTMTVPDAPKLINQLAKNYGSGALIGAGTVTNADQAKRCIDAGAEFLVSPGLAESVLSVAQACGKLAIPGALTPTELMAAQEKGAKIVKIFPCGSVGGPKYLQALKGPFPSASLIPTGGVTVTNAAEYIAAGAFAVGVGGDLVDAAAIRSGKLEKITQAARELVQSIAAARQ